MAEIPSPVFSENPFCTRRIRPGAIPFFFPPGEDVQTLIDRLKQSGWCGQIVGPHGSGKSTLLAALLPEIERSGHPTVLIELHDGQRQMPQNWRLDISQQSSAVLAVDGFEQLSRWNRWRLKRWCRRRGVGLVATSHLSVGLPQLYRTETSADLAQQIVCHCLGDRASLFRPGEIAESLARHGGDLRETLFDFYDLYEKRTRPPAKL